MMERRHAALTRTLCFVPAFALIAMLLASHGEASEKRISAPKIGAKTINLRFHDLKGATYSLTQPESLPAVYLFLSTQCPISNVYTPRFLALEKTYSRRGVHVFAVYSNAMESVSDITKHTQERNIRFPVIKDDGSLAKRLGATMTPEAVLVDKGGAVRYRGRIDDNKDPAQVQSHDLKEAVGAVLAGRPIAHAERPAFGCALRFTMPGNTMKLAKVTYARDIAPIIQQKCQECHRAGEVAPFALENYKQAANWAQQIKTYTSNRKMPPWKADSHGEFLSEKRLTDAQIAKLAVWADSGAPLGDPKETPKAPTFKSGWKLGAPDEIISMPETYNVSPDGRDIYQCFVIPTNYSEDKWVSGFEVHPGNRNVVHHVIAYIDTSGVARKLDAADPAPGYTNPTPGNTPGFGPAGILAAWAPGNETRFLPSGVGNLLPKGADIVLEVHYHKDGKPETDNTSVGIHFCKTPVQKRMGISFVGNFDFEIPAGERDHVIRAQDIVQEDTTVLGVAPHMHVVGRKMRATATLPDNRKIELINVPDWDFNWQLTYTYKEPIKLPKGTRIELEAHYDNSTSNPNNPNKPPKLVTYGEQTTNEMCLFGMFTTRDSEDLLTRKEFKLSPEDAAKYAGRYEFLPGYEAKLTNRGSNLYAKFPGFPEIQIYPDSETKFSVRIAPVFLTFRKNQKGEVSELTVVQSGAKQNAKRVTTPPLSELPEQPDPDAKLTEALRTTLDGWVNDKKDLPLLADTAEKSLPRTERVNLSRMLKEQKAFAYLKTQDLKGHESQLDGLKATRINVYKLTTDKETRYLCFYLTAEGKIALLVTAAE